MTTLSSPIRSTTALLTAGVLAAGFSYLAAVRTRRQNHLVPQHQLSNDTEIRAWEVIEIHNQLLDELESNLNILLQKIEHATFAKTVTHRELHSALIAELKKIFYRRRDAILEEYDIECDYFQSAVDDYFEHNASVRRSVEALLIFWQRCLEMELQFFKY